MNNIRSDEIFLVKETHKYVLRNDPSIVFNSATELVGMHFSPFDADAIANDLANNNPNYIGMTADDLMASWNAAAQHGTEVHEDIELYLNQGKTPVHTKSMHGIEWLEKYRMKSQIEIMPEVIIFSKELKIAGTVDIISKDVATDKYEIIDWKTGKLEWVSYRGKMGVHPITNDLMDCKFEKYSLQLSFYRYLLEEYYGLEIQNQLIAHITNEGCIGYVTPYYKEHIIKIINEIKQ